MTNHRFVRLTLLLALALVAVWPASAGVASAPAEPGAITPRVRLPAIFSFSTACPTTSNRSYTVGPVFQWDYDNPVRKAWLHADKNIELRDYTLNNGVSLSFIGGATENPQPPQLATLFNSPRVPTFTRGFRINNWAWADSPNSGTRLAPDPNGWPVSVIGMQTAAGESLHVPTSGSDIGAGMEVIVLYSDEDSIAFKYSREDTVVGGYTVQVDHICTDPNLLSLYNQYDDPSGLRYSYYGGPVGGVDYSLVTLSTGQVFGTARDTEIRVAVVDSGAWMDPRYCNDWWQIRPGHGC